jgi:chromosome segregation ATPase
MPLPKLPPAPVPAPAPKPVAALRPTESIDPNLTSRLRADYEALKNDVQQANEWAADLQKELAGKNEEFAHFKRLFDKAQTDLAQLNEGIVSLRQERHRLANEAMRATGLEMQLGRAAQECEQLKHELTECKTRELRAAETLRERDRQVAELTMELMTAKEALADAKRRLAEPRRGPHRKPKTAQVIRFDE